MTTPTRPAAAISHFESSRLRDCLVAVAAIGITVCTGSILAGCTAGSAAPAAVEPTTPAVTTPTAIARRWLPSERGDFLAPEKMALMSEADMRRACVIRADDPDAQTPDDVIRLWEYISTSAHNAPTTHDQVDPYRNDDGQVAGPAEDEFVKDVTERYVACWEALFNDGVKRGPSGFAKYVATVFAFDDLLDTDGKHAPYRVDADLVGHVKVSDDGTYTYVVDELDNFIDTIMNGTGTKWTTSWGFHHKASVHVSASHGYLVFTNRQYENARS